MADAELRWTCFDTEAPFEPSAPSTTSDGRVRSLSTSRPHVLSAMSTHSILASGLFGGIAAVAMLVLPFVVASAVRFRNRSRATVGTVVRMEDVPADEVSWAHVEYEVAGATFTARFASNGGYTVGERVPLRHHLEDPGRAHPEGIQVWLASLATLLVAVLSGVTAAILFVLGWHGVL
jgi:hypothetical protein